MAKAMHRLILMRHAQAEASAPSGGDEARPLSAAGRAEVGFDIGYMPPWTYLLGDVPEGVMALSGGIEPLVHDIRSARESGANTFHLKFRARDLPEYLDQVDAFAEQVVPLVDEG